MPPNEQPHSKRTPAFALKSVALLALLAMVGIAFGIVVLIAKGAGSGLNAWEHSRLGPLQRAASDGNPAECERLVKSGVPVDATDDDGVTALDWAIYNCQVDVVRKLVELGADVNHADKRGGFTPLMYTAISLRGHRLRGTEPLRNQIAQLLIQHGADVNHIAGDSHTIGSRQTALHFAAADKNAGLVRILLVAGANKNAKSDQGYTPLDVARFSDYAPNNEVISALEGR